MKSSNNCRRLGLNCPNKFACPTLNQSKSLNKNSSHSERPLLSPFDWLHTNGAVLWSMHGKPITRRFGFNLTVLVKYSLRLVQRSNFTATQIAFRWPGRCESTRKTDSNRRGQPGWAYCNVRTLYVNVSRGAFVQHCK